MFVFLHSKLYIDCVYVSNEKKNENKITLEENKL